MSRNERFNFCFIGVLVLIAILPSESFSFGKNKVNYDRFEWKFTETKHFDVYYYKEEENLISPILEMLEEAYDYLSAEFHHQLSERIPVVLYLNERHFQQTNIAPGFIPEGVAGFNEISMLRLVIPISGPRRQLKQLIIHEMVHSFEYDILFQSEMSQFLSKAPMWLMEGAAEYFADDWSADGTMVVRDAVFNDYTRPIEELGSFSYLPNAYLGYKLGAEIVKYLVEKYGKEKLIDFMWELRANFRTEKFLETASKNSFGDKIEDISKDFLRELKTRTWKIYETRDDPELKYGEQIAKPKKGFSNLFPVWSPGGELIAFFSNKGEKLNLRLTAIDKEKDFRNLTAGHSFLTYQGIVTDGKPLCWSDSGDLLAFFVREDRQRKLYLLDINKNWGKTEYSLSIDMPNSPTFSPSDKDVAFAGMKDNKYDIFIIDLTSKEVLNLTDDAHYDTEPDWSPDGEWIAFSSERDGFMKLFIKNILTDELRQLTFGQGNDVKPEWAPDGKSILFISDRFDLTWNIHRVFIDTLKVQRLTNVATGILYANFSPDMSKIAFHTYYDASFHIHIIDLPEPVETIEHFHKEKEAVSERDIFASPPVSKRLKFRLLPDEGIEGQVGYSSDGVLHLNAAISLSDILGNHRFLIQAENIAGYQNAFLGYYFLKERWDLGFVFFNYDQPTYIRFNWYRDRQSGGGVIFRYPLNIFYRFDFSFVGYRRKINYNFGPGISNFYNAFYPTISFNGDTTKWREFGPISGSRYAISFTRSVFGSKNNLDFVEYEVDYRKYIKLTKRSLFALRYAGIFSEGEDRLLYSIGGATTIRGYPWGFLTGTKVSILNLEYRFPLIDYIVFPGKILFQGLRGHFFFDSGAAWFDKDELNLWDKVDGGYEFKDLKASVGFGFSFQLGIFDFMFEFAHRTTLHDTEKNARYEFWIGQKF